MKRISFRPRVSKRSRASVVVGSVVAALALSSCSVYDLPLPGGADTGDDPITVNIKFRDVLDLVPQSTVKVDDVTVGKVTDIDLDGYTADVTVELPNDVDLPGNARAEIRQTSLLGEKFVSLSKPDSPEGELRDGDTIGLDNSGRNPEIEEVFSSLALVLNGGGVGQLKTISQELNKAFDGREEKVKSIITEVSNFMGQLDRNKTQIITALENVNRLSVRLNREDGSIKAALDELPAALESINGQRKDLVKVLKALSNLSSVGVDVIKASKESTIDALQNLAPVLSALAKAGDALPKSLQVVLTYPFIDEAVGRDPQVARDLRMGDFTNLSVNLSLDLFNLPNIPGLAPGVSIADLLGNCAKKPNASQCQLVRNLLNGTQLQAVCKLIPLLCKGSQGNGGGGAPNPNNAGSGGAGTGGGLGGLLGGITGGLGLGGLLGRTAPGDQTPAPAYQFEGSGYDEDVTSLLVGVG